MKIQIEKTVTSEIEVDVPSYWTDGHVYVKIIDETHSLVVQIWEVTETYSVELRSYVPNISGYKRITESHFYILLNKIITKIQRP